MALPDSELGLRLLRGRGSSLLLCSSATSELVPVGPGSSLQLAANGRAFLAGHADRPTWLHKLLQWRVGRSSDGRAYLRGSQQSGGVSSSVFVAERKVQTETRFAELEVLGASATRIRLEVLRSPLFAVGSCRFFWLPRDLQDVSGGQT